MRTGVTLLFDSSSQLRPTNCFENSHWRMVRMTVIYSKRALHKERTYRHPDPGCSAIQLHRTFTKHLRCPRHTEQTGVCDEVQLHSVTDGLCRPI